MRDARGRGGRGPVSAADGRVTLHASAVAIAGRGVLLLGASGSGKSALALRLIALGAALVGDDRVVVSRAGDGLLLAAHPAVEGLVEARGIGILRVPPGGPAPARLAVDLDQSPEARLPQWRKYPLLGAEVDLIPGRGVPHLGEILTVLVQSGGETV